MEVDATRALELMIGLPDVVFLGIEGGPDASSVHVECRSTGSFCENCGFAARVKERPVVALVDLPVFGRRTRLVWHKRRFACPDDACPRLELDRRGPPHRLRRGWR